CAVSSCKPILLEKRAAAANDQQPQCKQPELVLEERNSRNHCAEPGGTRTGNEATPAPDPSHQHSRGNSGKSSSERESCNRCRGERLVSAQQIRTGKPA